MPTVHHFSKYFAGRRVIVVLDILVVVVVVVICSAWTTQLWSTRKMSALQAVCMELLARLVQMK